jgi:hypothetical protein
MRGGDLEGRVQEICEARGQHGLTVHLLEDTLDGAGAAAACHGYIELVVVFGHVGCGR